MKISVVIPAYNESGSIDEVCAGLEDVFRSISHQYEIICVDDGSTDGTSGVMQALLDKNNKIRTVKCHKNTGKTAALAAGIKIATGNIIITMDADLQNDPKDIPDMLGSINKGYDLVCGWRHQRKDNMLKVFLSKTYNSVISVMFGIKLHDINCGFKAFRKKVADTTLRYRGDHRYIPILAMRENYRIAEIKVRHNKRKYGRSKYHLFRINAVFDIIKLYIATKTLMGRYDRKEEPL